MSQKVKLPKAVCDALEDVRNHMFNYSHSAVVSKTLNKGWERHELKVLNGQNADVIMCALVLGYEPEMTPEEQIKEFYSTEFPEGTIDENGAFRMAIRETLRIHGIHYDWLEEYAE